jgi:hypothetical protein
MHLLIRFRPVSHVLLTTRVADPQPAHVTASQPARAFRLRQPAKVDGKLKPDENGPADPLPGNISR